MTVYWIVFDTEKLKKQNNDSSDDNLDLVTCLTEGIFTDEAFETCLNMAREGSLTVYNLIRLTMERKATTPILPLSSSNNKQTPQTVVTTPSSEKKSNFIKPKE